MICRLLHQAVMMKVILPFIFWSSQWLMFATAAFTDGFTFKNQTTCPGQVVVASACSLAPFASRGRPSECALHCQRDPGCLAFQVDLSLQTWCRLCSQNAWTTCSNTQLAGSVTQYDKMIIPVCLNGGVLNADLSCQCQGATGKLCEIPMTDCQDWYYAGYVSDGVYWIKTSGTSPAFQIQCGMQWMRNYVMSRTLASFDFYRNWTTYVNGFGTPSGDFWLGMKHWSQFSSQRCYTLFVEFHGNAGPYYQQFYTNFTVASETQQFRFNFFYTSYFDNPLGDCLTFLRGYGFSTYDVDNDGDVNQNCAERHHSGWWMGGANCTRCNPTGMLLQPADNLRSGVDAEVFWVPDTIGNFAPSKVYMWFQRC